MAANLLDKSRLVPFPPQLKEIIETRFPHTRILGAELITGGDGKIHYFLPLRLRLYRQIYRWIRQFAPEVPVYFCMESPIVWREGFGFHLHSTLDVVSLLDDTCHQHLVFKST